MRLKAQRISDGWLEGYHAQTATYCCALLCTAVLVDDRLERGTEAGERLEADTGKVGKAVLARDTPAIGHTAQAGMRANLSDSQARQTIDVRGATPRWCDLRLIRLLQFVAVHPLTQAPSLRLLLAAFGGRQRDGASHTSRHRHAATCSPLQSTALTCRPRSHWLSPKAKPSQPLLSCDTVTSLSASQRRPLLCPHPVYSAPSFPCLVLSATRDILVSLRRSSVLL